MSFIVSIMRYIAPITALIVIGASVVSLFRNRPRVHKLARLIDTRGGEPIEIDHWETSIGKSKSNDIVLDYPAIARFHAVIAKKRRDWVITNTSNRTSKIKVNGDDVENSAVLENGDLITIGGTEMKFECEEAINRKTRQQIRTAVKTSAPRTVAYAVLVDVKTRRPVYIKNYDVLIGRGPDCDIQLSNQTVSAHHARIHKTSRGWALSDLDSHNGTKLNGRYINQPQLIFDEDMISFSDRVFIFYEK